MPRVSDRSSSDADFEGWTPVLETDEDLDVLGPGDSEDRRTLDRTLGGAATPLPVILARPLSELLANPELLREPATEIPYLLIENATTLVCAREKTGKTTVVSQAICARIDQTSFLGVDLRAKAPVNVLWYSIDEPLRDTVIRFSKGLQDVDRLHINAEPRNLDELLRYLRADLEAHTYQIVVVDTLSRAFQQSGIKTNDPDVVGAAVRRVVDLFREFSVAGLLIYHTNKTGSVYSGAVSIGATVDEIVVLVKGKADDSDNDDDLIDDGRRRLVCDGRRLRDTRSLSFIDGRYQLDDAPRGDRLALAVLKAATGAGAPFKKSELAAAAKGRKQHTLKEIDALRAGGELVEHAGRYSITTKGRKRLGQEADVNVDLAI